MELYILSNIDLSILSITKPSEYEINLDEETNAKSTFNLIKSDGLKKGNFIIINGLYEQFLFLIDDVETEKGSNVSTVTALHISNIFDRKIIEKDTDTMTTKSIEEFIANTISENFVNSDDIYTNVDYIDIYWKTNTKTSVATNAENGLYNFHTFLTNCRQYKNIYTTFKFQDGRLRIDIENKEDSTVLIDTTVPEVTDYNKVYESDVTAKVQVLIREDNSIYNLYLKTDRTTTENKNDPDRASGRIETISVDTVDTAREEALNVIKGNTYNHLVEFKIAKTSKLMDVTELYVGRNVRIRTEDDIYDSYISAITLRDENFIYFKSGNLRTTLIDKLKKSTNTVGNKLDTSGGVIKGNLEVEGKLTPTNGIYANNQKIMDFNANGKAMAIGKVSEAEGNEELLEIAIPLKYEKKMMKDYISSLVYPIGSIYVSVNSTNPSTLFGGSWVQISDRFLLSAGSTYNAGATGGSSSINLQHNHTTAGHTLTLDEIPSHKHDLKYSGVDINPPSSGSTTIPKVNESSSTHNSKYSGGGKSHSHGDTGNALSTTQSIMPPYLVVYMWKRTA